MKNVDIRHIMLVKWAFSSKIIGVTLKLGCESLLISILSLFLIEDYSIHVKIEYTNILWFQNYFER